jgi:hypothetical protein
MMVLMVDRDPAFLWETEALRTSAVAPDPGLRRAASPEPRHAPDGWLTLREASSATGIPVATLRKWALKEKMPSVLDVTGAGTHRMVSLEAVRARARQVGRVIEEIADTGTGDVTEDVVTQSTTAPVEASPPPGTMLVPIDAWDKMLLQLGNLHEAGQQLAEARERAARAETEAVFLRERLAEMRATGDRVVEGASIPDAAASGTTQPKTIPSFTAYLWRSAVSTLRRKG